MERRRLGRTGIEVGEIGFGAWAISGRGYGPTDDRTSMRALHRALDLGVDFIDTADAYGDGHSEELVGRVLRERRDRRVVVATKVGWDFYGGRGLVSNLRRDYIRFAVRQSLRRLGRDVIDIYQVHDSDPAAMDDNGVFDTMEELKREGLVRFWGVSAARWEDGLYALEHAEPDVLQVAYNIFDQEPSRRLLPLAAERGVAVIAREPLACGLLTGKYGPSSTFGPRDHRGAWSSAVLAEAQRRLKMLDFLRTPQRTLVQAAIRFALAHPAVGVVIPGAKTPQQVEENVGAARVRLEADEVAKLKELYELGFAER